ncbi:MAG: hypothetical protein KDD56_00195 [Bdellovibrionales bacterium]|nr:hypothetical protein [Bdellovibrionales bacterium]
MVKENEKKKSDRLKRYEVQDRRQTIINYLAIGTCGVFIVLTILLALTGNFYAALNVIGIEAAETAGVYIDCSQKKNKDNKYCQTTEELSQSDRDWRSLRNSNSRTPNSQKREKPRGGAFSLYQ